MKFLAVLFLAAVAVQGLNTNQPRAFGGVSLFNVVTFKNDPCDSTESLTSTTSDSKQRQGNCVASSECTDDKGKAAGSCASGFGVCCVFTMNDADDTSVTVTRNNTYLQNPEFPTAFAKAETFTYEFEKQNKDICAIRLDFESFTLAQPTDEETNGCQVDKFEITSISSGLTIPVVCGALTGQHMYLYLGDDNAGDSATAKLTTTGTATMRTWDIKVGQIDCASEYLPPMGCLQYHLESSGTIKTFNFDGASNIHLPAQDYAVCMRRMAGFCCVEYQVCSDDANSFRLGGAAAAAAVDAAACSEDYVYIEGGSQDGNIPTSSRFCGAFFSSATGGVADVPVVSCTDYKLRIVTNTGGDTTPFTVAGALNKGACLEYRLLPC